MWGEFEDTKATGIDASESRVEPRQDENSSCSMEDEEEIVLDALPLKDRIIHHIASSSLTLKSQQRYEPDLTFEERKTLTGQLLDKPGQFLFRFGKHLEREHFQYFLKFEGNPEVDHYVTESLKHLNKHTTKIMIRNRRYAAMQELRHSGSYFSEKEMERRDPLLFDQLIGRHQTEEEKRKYDEDGEESEREIRFSSLLLSHIDNCSERSLKNQLEEEEDDMLEEEDSDDDDNDGEERERMEDSIESGQKQLLKEEFYSSQYHSFLGGKDTEFDYGKIDTSDNYDLLDIRARDEEERYFDDDDDEDDVVNSVQDNLSQLMSDASVDDSAMCSG